MLKQQRSSILNDDGVLLCGYYKKLKTMKKKFFVLFNETPCNVARIEYYDNEKKYKSGFNPKRIIKIKSCFNINRRLYTKHDFVIVLSSKEGGFGIVMDSEDEMNTWLNHLLHLQRQGETSFDFPKFDYVWQVIIQKKGVAEQHNLFGNYHICLTNKSITFIKIGREKNLGDKKITKIEVLLTTIRRCGDSQCYFYMEIGRQSSLGPGELWMETEDSLTAQNMHKMILSKMISLNEALIEPMRKRSSSATETTNLDNDKKFSHNMDSTNSYLLNAKNFSRDRCDSLPSRNRTSSECSSRMIPTTSANRITNFNISSTSQFPYSASEESVSVDDSEENNGMPYLISSRSPEGVIPEEYIDDEIHSPKGYENTDRNSVDAISMGADSKTKINIIKQCGAAKMTDANKDIWSNVDNQLHFPVRAYSFGSKGENELAKEALVNRVRAFSVGSRIKCPRICSKTSPKLFNSDNIKNDFVESSTRKSISVPILINKNIQSIDKMSDLMEIDFSKPTYKTLKESFQPNECQMVTGVLNILNSTESIHKNIKSVDNGYLEMKPITLIPNNIATHVEQKDIIDNINLSEKGLYNNNEDVIKECTTSLNKTIVSSEQSKNDCEANIDISCINQDLYYASLDLPKCNNAVNTRYGLKDSFNDINNGEIANEYAKINFDQPETSCTERKKKII